MSKHTALFSLVAGALVVAGCSAPTSAPRPAATTVPAAPAAQAPAARSGENTQATPSAAPAAAAVAPLERQPLHLGYLPIIAAGPLFIAQERGYFAEQALDTEWTQFDSGALMVSSVAAGQIDVIFGVPGPSLFNALARDVPIRAVALLGNSGTSLMLRKELADSGQVQTLQDLKGRRVSFNVEGSPVDYTARNAFSKVGLTLNDFQVERVANTDLAPALANGAVDAGVAPEPIPVLIETRAIGVRFGDVQRSIGRQLAAMMTIGPSMLNRGDGPTRRFLVAYVRGMRDYVAAHQRDKLVDPQVLAIMSQWTKLPTETLAQAINESLPTDVHIDLQDVSNQQEFWVREGLVPQRADLAQFVDHKYLDAALAQIR